MQYSRKVVKLHGQCGDCGGGEGELKKKVRADRWK